MTTRAKFVDVTANGAVDGYTPYIGAGKRIWFVYRDKLSGGSGMEIHSTLTGRYIRYATIFGALKAATRLNGAAS